MARNPDPRFAPNCTILFDGQPMSARVGESVTSALIAAGLPLLSRSAKYHRPRGPFCLSSSCTSCLVRVDDVPNVRACETSCREGLRIETQNTLGGASHDLLGVVDLLTPKGIDHHHMATWNQMANRLTVKASRQLAGLGRLSSQMAGIWPAAADEHFDAVVVGSGPAGLGAAEVLGREKRKTLLCESEKSLGGRLRCRYELPGDPSLSWATGVADIVRHGGGEVATGASVIGLWHEEGAWLMAIVQRGAPTRMRLARTERVVLANGTWAQPPLFEGNDIPGIYSARGLAVALAEDGVVPGKRAVVLGCGPEAEAIVTRFSAAGMAVSLVSGEVVRAEGRRRLTGLELAGGQSMECDTMVVATPRTPALELARVAGAVLELDQDSGSFHVRPSEGGAIAPGVFVTGEVVGPCTAVEAVRSGQAAGMEAIRG